MTPPTRPPTDGPPTVPVGQLPIAGADWPDDDDHSATIVRLPLLPSPAEMGVLSAQRRHIQEQLKTATVRAIETVGTAAAAVALAGEQLDQAVSYARAEGASWAEIGRAVGISRQAAAERWGTS